VIHARGEDKYQAMKSAPLVVLAEIVSAELVRGAKRRKAPGVGGPMTAIIPLHLAQISAKILLTLRGSERNTVRFYCWVWASGKHGGPRLFNRYPGSTHILFLGEEGRYPHTVGDYPAYDLDVPSSALPRFMSEWKSRQVSGSDVFEQIATVLLRTELKEAWFIRRNYWPENMADLIGLTSPFFIASKLDSFCRQFANPFGRFAACDATAREFGGRCAAYRLAKEADSNGTEADFLAQSLADCEAWTTERIESLRSRNWSLRYFDDGWRQTPERHRLAMRLYASAMDAKFHKAACDAAVNMPEARDIPECSTPRLP
jgi:hypothetical protein